MFGMGTTELLIVFGIFVLFFGARKIPEVAAGLGKSIGSFKRAMREGDEPPAEARAAPPATKDKPAT